MGKGNVAVFGKNEGLYYVSNEFIESVSVLNSDGDYDMLTRRQAYEQNVEGEYDQIASEYEFNNFVDTIVDGMENRFHSFFATDRWERDNHIICENNLFKVAIADNEWSYAVLLLEQDDTAVAGLQGMHFARYFNELKNILLSTYPEIGIYDGPWTHKVIRRENNV